MIDFGETYSSPNFEVRDVNGQLADAGTVKVDITKPDGTAIAQFDANHPSLGTYNYDQLTANAGRHLGIVTATGGTLGSIIRKFVDAFVVRPANPAMAVSLADGKAHLGEQSDLQDDEIRGYIQVATEIVEQFTGPLGVRTYTDRVRNGIDRFKLFNKPVVSVTSVTSIRTPTTQYLTADLDVDGEYGIVYRKDGQSFLNGPWTVVYTAGHTTVNERWIKAVKKQLWSMWVDQRGQTADSTTPDLSDVADYESRVPFGLGFLIPYHVMQLVEHDHVPGFA